MSAPAPAERGSAPAPAERGSDASIGQLIGDISDDLSRLFRQELELAKAELRQEAGMGWAALIVAVVWGIAGAVLYANGRRKLRAVSPVPEQTVETLKEDARWLKNPTG